MDPDHLQRETFHQENAGVVVGDHRSSWLLAKWLLETRQPANAEHYDLHGSSAFVRFLSNQKQMTKIVRSQISDGMPPPQSNESLVIREYCLLKLLGKASKKCKTTVGQSYTCGQKREETRAVC